MKKIEKICDIILLINSILLLIIGITLICSATAYAAETWYTATDLNLRSEPTTDSGVITVYQPHTELTVIGTDGGEWWQVWDGECQGWVNKHYMSPYADNGIFTYHGHSDTPLCAVTVTQYDTSPAENGGYTVTACGDQLTDVVGLAIAADPRLLPMGSKVYIEGVGYRTVRDVGGAIKGAHIDNLVWNIDYSWDINAWHNVYAAW
ncbi:MAG: SH3 domain-containing protein [Clostridia bacterium]|nr:SH3 domain-containing protein [Clostridia bacterium]MBQ3462115.1 SH3 domain-containing protein [Clostridia bacterium]MBQ3472241.1 SH3 domain-containing protein [Clostridia bacterium]MBR0470970.1 SH3 domain-containing protein [Clostridia bacterium]